MRSITYRFCPQCAGEMAVVAHSGHGRPTCTDCGFVHFRDPKVAVLAVISHGRRVLLIKRRYGAAKGRWALPGGFMDAGEMPQQALIREVREEVGLTVTAGEILDILPMNDPEAGLIGIVIAFVAVPSSPPVEKPDAADDAAAARWFAPDALPENMAFEGTRRLIRLWQTVAA